MLVCFRFGSFIANKYINITLKDVRLLQVVFDSSTGAANQANIGIAALKDILIPLPPLAEQTRIVQKLDELMKCCDALETSIKESQSTNEKLLQQVLREALRGDSDKNELSEIGIDAEPKSLKKRKNK
ncbi:MAG: restriction endonuclease subunit S [Crocinitomicaceae bacterium]|nr:restriction endonuclease subunit S [Crocinitomicaceae bacterium]